MPEPDDLARALAALAARFVDQVVALVAAHAGAHPPAPRPRVRRPSAEIDDLADAIVRRLARESAVPVRVLAGALGTTSRALARPLALLVASGRVVKIGDRKATVYALPRRPHAHAAPPRRKAGAGSRRAR